MIDLNADLGEGMSEEAALMALVTSCNIATGGHAGDDETMVAALRMARDHGVAAGAHPAYPDRAGFGRRDLDLPLETLAQALADQVGTLERHATAEGMALTHVKPHGALYHRASVDPAHADVLANLARAHGLFLVGPPGGAMAAAAGSARVVYVPEGFADRAYDREGRLLPRSAPGAVIEDAEAATAQARDLAAHGRVRTQGGEDLALDVATICLHGDTPGAVARARAVRAGLEAAGLTLRAPL